LVVWLRGSALLVVTAAVLALSDSVIESVRM